MDAEFNSKTVHMSPVTQMAWGKEWRRPHHALWLHYARLWNRSGGWHLHARRAHYMSFCEHALNLIKTNSKGTNNLLF